MRDGIAVKLAAAAVAAAVASGAHTASAQGILKADTTGVGGVNHTLFVVLANILQKKAGINMQVNEGQTLTRSALKLGKGKIDIQPLPPVITPWLRKGIRMYKKAPDVAKKAVANIRLIASYGAGVRHYLVWADSGIETFDDLKGKRVFVGPPVGGASVVAMAVLRITAGLKADKDYTQVRLPWNGGIQAMQDGKIDVFIRPAGIGAASIEQLGAKRKFRLLSVAPYVDKPAFRKYLGGGGRVLRKVPAGTYKNQANNDKDVATDGFRHQLVVNKNLSDDLVYRITRTLFESLPEMHKTAAILSDVSLEDTFSLANVPVHPGALKYYKEIGKKVPAALMPGG